MKRFFKIAMLLFLPVFFQNVFAGDSYPGIFIKSITPAKVDTISYVFIDYIRGAKLGTGNKLDWKVSCFSTPSVTISVERSADGLFFTALEEQFATATRCQQPFSFNDVSPLPGLNYYRVKTTDIDGGQTYSFTVPILNADKGLVMGRITPNPVQSSAVLQISSAEKSAVTIIISSLNGRQVSRRKYVLIAGSNEINLNLAGSSPGGYQLTLITSDGEKKSLHFVKQ